MNGVGGGIHEQNQEMIAWLSLKKCGVSNTIYGTGAYIYFDHYIGSSDEITDSFPSDCESNEDFLDFELS